MRYEPWLMVGTSR